jgi:hypothetical protein
MSVVPLAIAHAFVDKKSTSVKDGRLRVVNLMDMSGADRMQKMMVVCRREDIRIQNGVDVTIDSDPAFKYLQESLMRKLDVGVVFFTLGEPSDPILHSSTEEFAYEYCLLVLDSYQLMEVDSTARAATFRVCFI